jgi:shikimate dehydrogenase
LKKYALIGRKIEYSYSAIVHKEIALSAGIELDYTVMSVEPQGFIGAVDRLKNAYDGFNITKPYKSEILPYLYKNHSVTGAVNTVSIDDGELIGYNTDGIGFLQSLKYHNIKIGKDVLILGAGGAARTLAYELDKLTDVYICNRTPEKVTSIINELNLKNTHIADLDKLSPSLIINATTLGLNNEMSLPQDIRTDRLNAVYDTIYNPCCTPLLDWAKKQGIKAVNGLGMLFFQALEAQKIWNNIRLTRAQIFDTIKNIEARI